MSFLCLPELYWIGTNVALPLEQEPSFARSTHWLRRYVARSWIAFAPVGKLSTHERGRRPSNGARRTNDEMENNLRTLPTSGSVSTDNICQGRHYRNLSGKLRSSPLIQKSHHIREESTFNSTIVAVEDRWVHSMVVKDESLTLFGWSLNSC
jgi:hypothetical protein